MARSSTLRTTLLAVSPGSTRYCGARGSWQAGGAWTPTRSSAPGQMSRIDRALSAYPQLSDDSFVRERLDGWLT